MHRRSKKHLLEAHYEGGTLQSVGTTVEFKKFVRIKGGDTRRRCYGLLLFASFIVKTYSAFEACFECFKHFRTRLSQLTIVPFLIFEMAEEQSVAELAALPSVLEATPATAEATASRIEVTTVVTSNENSDDIDIEEDNTTIWPTKPSHVNFGKSTTKEGRIDVLNRLGYIDNMDWVRLGGDDVVPNPRKDKVVIFRSFHRAGLKFPLHKTLVAMLKRFNIYLHQLTPNAIVRLRIIIWAVRSQGVGISDEALCEAFCQVHELHFQTKATGGLHNNFGCYNFAYRRGVMSPAPAYRSKWLNGCNTQIVRVVKCPRIKKYKGLY